MKIQKGDYGYLQSLRQENRNKNIVFVAGVFDVFHPTHIQALQSAKLQGNVLVVGIVSDLRVKQRKGVVRPILNEQERAEIVDNIKGVDYVFTMDDPQELNPGRPTLDVIKNLRPNIFQTVDKEWLIYKDIIEQCGTLLRVVPRIGEISSTIIINRILEKNKKIQF